MMIITIMMMLIIIMITPKQNLSRLFCQISFPIPYSFVYSLSPHEICRQRASVYIKKEELWTLAHIRREYVRIVKSFLHANNSSICQENSSQFLSAVSLLYSKAPVACRYPGPDESSPHRPTLIFRDFQGDLESILRKT